MVLVLWRRGNLLSLRHIISRMSGREKSQLTVFPQDALVDQPVDIQVKGLRSHQCVTVHGRLVYKDNRFSSWTHMVADDDGRLDLTRQPSMSGTYTGIEPMGLFWSMIPEAGQRKGVRLTKTEVDTPYSIVISVLDGHVAMETVTSLPSEFLCRQTVQRWYKSKDVTRKEIKIGNIRGSMFIPPGPGPHPGIIDMFGTIGGCIEYRASLLASRGFTTLALAWFSYDDLPKSVDAVDLHYFLEAFDWFSSQPEVCKSGIGTIGTSKGSDFALLMAMMRPNVKAVVSLGGTPFIMFCDLKYGDGFLPGVKASDAANLEMTPNGLSARGAFNPRETHYFDYSRITGKVLFLAGEEDGTLSPGQHEPAMENLSADKRKNFQSIVYEKTGHLIEPPYTPVCNCSFHKEFGILLNWGGEIDYHAKAEESSWNTMLEFFRESLCSKQLNPPRTMAKL